LRKLQHRIGRKGRRQYSAMAFAYLGSLGKAKTSVPWMYNPPSLLTICPPLPHSFICLSFQLSIYPFVCPTVCPSICLLLCHMSSVQLSLFPLFVYMSIHSSICLYSAYTSIHLFIHLSNQFVHLPVCPTVHTYVHVCLSVHLSVRLSVYQPNRTATHL
jgi:hypothetical protein